MGDDRIPLIAQFRETRTFVAAAALALLLIGAVWVKNAAVLQGAKTDAITWDAVFSRIQHDWPEVPQMSTDELARRMAAHDGAGPLLIDVRSREEYKVSHLPGALSAETPGEIAAVLQPVSAQQPVVLYCSVGIRSSKAAAKLMRSGRANVYNLQGSIFKWANEGRPLIAEDHAIQVVHPYNERWGVLLKPEVRSYSSSTAERASQTPGMPKRVRNEDQKQPVPEPGKLHTRAAPAGCGFLE